MPLFRFERNRKVAKKKIGDLISAWMQEFSESNPYELSRTEFVKEAGTWYLRVYVDKLENGTYGYMSSDDCAIVSHYLSSRLDEEDPIEQNYYLEVSSPGMDRPLITDKDFTRFMGERIEISLYKALNGSKNLEGKLVGYDGSTITLLTDKNEELAVSKESAGKINLAVVF